MTDLFQTCVHFFKVSFFIFLFLSFYFVFFTPLLQVKCWTPSLMNCRPIDKQTTSTTYTTSHHQRHAYFCSSRILVFLLITKPKSSSFRFNVIHFLSSFIFSQLIVTCLFSSTEHSSWALNKL